MKAYLLLAVGLFSLLGGSASAQDTRGNGGARVAYEFRSTADVIVKILEANQSVYPEILAKDFELAVHGDASQNIDPVKVFALDRTYIIIDGVEVETDATSYPDQKLINVNATRWIDAYSSGRISLGQARNKVGVVFHEYLQILGLEQNTYTVSSRLTNEQVLKFYKELSSDWLLVTKPEYLISNYEENRASMSVEVVPGRNLMVVYNGVDQRMYPNVPSSIAMRDLPTGKVIWQKPITNTGEPKFLFNSDSSQVTVATSYYDDVNSKKWVTDFQILNVVTGAEIRKVTAPESLASFMYLSDNQLLVTKRYGLDEFISFFDLKTGKFTMLWEPLPSAMYIKVSPDRKSILYDDGTVLDLDLVERVKLKLPQPNPPMWGRQIHYSIQLLITSDSKSVVALTTNLNNEINGEQEPFTSRVELFDIYTGDKKATLFKGTGEGAYANLLTVSKNLIVIEVKGKSNSEIQFWSMEGEFVKSVKIDGQLDRYGHEFKLSPDEKYFLVSGSGKATLYSVEKGVIVNSFGQFNFAPGKNTSIWITDLDFSYDQKHVMVRGNFSLSSDRPVADDITIWQSGL